MTALAADREQNTKYIHGDPEGISADYPVATLTTIYKGGFVGLNATGYLVMHVAATAGATLLGNRFVGMALEHVDNSAGLDGARKCKVLISGMIGDHVLSAAAQLDIGKLVYLSDDNTLSKEGSGHAPLGVITNVPAAGYVDVMMTPHLGAGGNSRLLVGVSDIIDVATLNQLAMIFHHTQNHNGLLVMSACIYVTTLFACDQTPGVVTVEDTDGTDVTTLTATEGDAVGDIIQTAANKTALEAASGSALVLVPADKGLQAKVTTACADSGTAAGAGKVISIAIEL
jgi:hypothetical protein